LVGGEPPGARDAAVTDAPEPAVIRQVPWWRDFASVIDNYLPKQCWHVVTARTWRALIIDITDLF